VASVEELAEFHSLSRKVSAKTASDRERLRWRELRARLSTPPPPPPPPATARQHARAVRKLKVEFAPVSSLHSTFTEEISAGGLKLRVPTNLEPGTPMVLRLELGEPGPLIVTARVAWCKRDGGHYLAGFEFVRLREDERDRIEAWTVTAGPVSPPPTTTRT
jgi:hypothetical protein